MGVTLDIRKSLKSARLNYCLDMCDDNFNTYYSKMLATSLLIKSRRTKWTRKYKLRIILKYEIMLFNRHIDNYVVKHNHEYMNYTFITQLRRRYIINDILF